MHYPNSIEHSFLVPSGDATCDMFGINTQKSLHVVSSSLFCGEGISVMALVFFGSGFNPSLVRL